MTCTNMRASPVVRFDQSAPACPAAQRPPRTEAGSLQQDAVVKALDHARIAQGPGGAAEMVPGQHHVRMNMYIAQANNGTFKIVKSLGVTDPKECSQGMK
jgi:hypothetical protein